MTKNIDEYKEPIFHSSASNEKEEKPQNLFSEEVRKTLNEMAESVPFTAEELAKMHYKALGDMKSLDELSEEEIRLLNLLDQPVKPLSHTFGVDDLKELEGTIGSEIFKGK
jgi:hypothetical protein